MRVRNKIFDNLFKTRLDLKVIRATELTNLIYNEAYQIVDICPHHMWMQNHILFTVNLTPTNFKYQYADKLDRKKKILLTGNWHKNAYYYRLLSANGYQVYLMK
jgi:hypothetical protein